MVDVEESLEESLERAGPSTHRLHIDGLPSDVSDAELARRFTPFGEVREASVIRGADGACRGFGYVSLHAAPPEVARCIKAYTGTRWRGKRLAVAPASEDYMTRLKREWEEAAEQRRAEEAAAGAAAAAAAAERPAAHDPAATLRLRPSRHLDLVEATPGKSNRHRRSFPPLQAEAEGRRAEKLAAGKGAPAGEARGAERVGAAAEARRPLAESGTAGGMSQLWAAFGAFGGGESSDADSGGDSGGGDAGGDAGGGEGGGSDAAGGESEGGEGEGGSESEGEGGSEGGDAGEASPCAAVGKLPTAAPRQCAVSPPVGPRRRAPPPSAPPRRRWRRRGRPGEARAAGGGATRREEEAWRRCPGGCPGGGRRLARRLRWRQVWSRTTLCRLA